MMVVVLFFGISTAVSADTLGCVGGMGVGVGLGSLIGGGNGKLAAQVIGGLAGCNTGSRIEDGTYGRQASYDDVEVRYIYRNGQRQGYYGNGQVIGYGNNGQPMCHDSRSGGHIECAFLARNPRYECCGVIERNVQYQPVRPVSASNQQQLVGYTNNRDTAPTAIKPAPVESGGPTINDYTSVRWVKVIPPDCRVGNFGHDSECLRREADNLRQKQRDCEADGRKCNPNFNFGKAEKHFRKLAGELRSAQNN